MQKQDKLAGRDFSFWKWFVACLHLIHEHIKPEWQKGLVCGFISREESEKKLLKEKPGTFLLRFSESSMENSQKSGVCGDLAMVLVEVDPADNKKKIFHLKKYLQASYLESQKALNRRLSDVLKMFKVADPSDPDKKRTLLRWSLSCV
ncbi:hypothetical protein HELRODRAFT_179435 [Helobdella robusta]|uniref:SH2 domain-containing protein n=1 Tax=Helobdella robusta TaxID=6412 RepID=T1FEP6_HELRO|nr:hypothetical protein HELRODRAFT_179435 [Helobdella robusta]ESN95364.1 hypothetical protein HELRODRAFT_179435 [Helobdella robusta]